MLGESADCDDHCEGIDNIWLRPILSYGGTSPPGILPVQQR
jgi:hypothetical protein